MPAAPRLPVDQTGGFGPGGSGISVEPPNITWPGMPPPGYMGGGELGSSGLGSPSSIDVYGGTPGFVPPVGIPNVWYSPTLFPYGTPFPVPPPPLPNVPPPPGGASPPAGTVSGTGQPVNWGPGVGTGQVSLTPNAPFSGGATGSGAGGVGPQFVSYGGPNLGGGGQYGGGGYGMGGSIGQYSPGAYSAGLSAALGQTGFFPSNPGSHQSFGAIQQRGGRVPFDTPAYLHAGERVIPANGDMEAANRPVRDWGWFPSPGHGSPGAGTSGGLQTGGGGGIRIPPIPIPPTIPPGFLPPNFQVPQIPAGWMSFVPPRFQQFF